MNYYIYVDGFKIDSVEWPENLSQIAIDSYVYGWSMDRGVSPKGVRAR